jgi:rubrerythrin
VLVKLPEASSIIVLEENEKKIDSWEGRVERRGKAVVEDGKYLGRTRVVLYKVKEKGNLVLTNRRLVWVERRGVFNRSQNISFEIPLEQIKSISGGSYSRYYDYIDIVGDKAEYRFDLDDCKFNRFNYVVRPLIQTRKEQIESERREKALDEMVHYNIATSFEFGKDGALLVRCPYCSSPKPQTDKSNDVKCPHCGQTYVVPKKILDLI